MTWDALDPALALGAAALVGVAASEAVRAIHRRIRDRAAPPPAAATTDAAEAARIIGERLARTLRDVLAEDRGQLAAEIARAFTRAYRSNEGNGGIR